MRDSVPGSDVDLKPYKGILSPNEAAEGMVAAARNAQRLHTDAKSLYYLAKYPSAASLAILSIEESGKVAILRRLVVAIDANAAKSIWREYRSHRSKNVMWILPQLVLDGAKRLDDFREVFDRNSDHPKLLDNLKQIGFYTDCLGKRNWAIPEKVIGRDVALAMIQISGILVPRDDHSEAELRAWKSHMTGLENMTDAEARRALVQYERELQQLGLEIPEFAQFVSNTSHDDA